MSEDTRKFDWAPAATRPPGGSIKVEPGEQVALEQSPSPSHLKTWSTGLTPSVVTPPSSSKRAASSEPGDSPKPGHSRGARRELADSQIAEFLCDSGSEADVLNSSDDDDLHADTVNMRLVAQKLRELAVLQEERQTEALAAFLTDADIATEELAEDEPAHPLSVEDVLESANVGEVAGPEYSFSWSDDFSLFSGQEEEYTRHPGPTTSCEPNPLEIFNLIWDQSILAQIACRTNEYACRTILDLTRRGSLPKYLDDWVETNEDEIRRFFGVIILMSLCSRPHIDEFWATGVMEMPVFKTLIAQNRFKSLLRLIHFADNSNMATQQSTYEKRIAKIAPVIDYLNNKFSSIYTPERELSLDESLLLWKGRLRWVQCLKTKARFGIKALELCELSTGYLLKSILYAGNDSISGQGAIHGLDNKTGKVVLELMDGFLDVGHLVVMDNWYNQLSLTRFLKGRGTDVEGTMNRNRAFVPPEIKNAGHGPQEPISRHCGDIAITTCHYQCKILTVISTSPNGQVQGRRGGSTLTEPVAVEVYNKSMGGVYLKDRRISQFKMELERGLNWYKKVFFRLLNTSVLNAYIIYRKHPSTSGLSHGEFRYRLGEALVKTSAPVAIRPNLSLERLQQGQHFPGHTAAVEHCVRCKAMGKREEVNTMCCQCNVALCMGQCFIDYHTLEEL